MYDSWTPNISAISTLVYFSLSMAARIRIQRSKEYGLGIASILNPNIACYSSDNRCRQFT